jgi:hypothetical protein
LAIFCGATLVRHNSREEISGRVYLDRFLPQSLHRPSFSIRLAQSAWRDMPTFFAVLDNSPHFIAEYEGYIRTAYAGDDFR